MLLLNLPITSKKLNRKAEHLVASEKNLIEGAQNFILLF